MRAAQAAPVDSQDLGSVDDPGRAALHAAPKFARDTISDRARKALPVVVYTHPAAAVLHFVDRRGPGDDDLRIVAQQPGFRPRAGVAPADEHGARAGRGVERVPVDPLPGFEPPARLRPEIGRAS